ncbi:MAG: hypothetical protein QOC96_3693 [Acidobacteriota bacterium]|jgi:hypothetical protein|nr:hypothetical protein [Acidobacteriota bacterium]
MKKIYFLILFAMCLLLNTQQFSNAQQRHIRNTEASKIVVFDSLCTSRVSFPKAKLRDVVSETLKREGIESSLAIGTEAFAFDLNGDSKPEYFVPLTCGAVGNCTWGIYAVNPTRLLGIIYGKYIYIRKSFGKWRNISTYSHLAINWGGVSTYGFKKGQLIKMAKDYEVTASEVRIPEFLKAEPICDPDGSSYEDKPHRTK